MSSSNWLSFNESVTSRFSFTIPGAPEKESPECESALREPMPLKTPWTLWEQVATGSYSTSKVCTFHTAQQFWSVWNGVPQPSELLENKRFFREQTNGPPLSIDALMIFREGIEPQWEDEANAKGGHFQIQLKPPSGGGLIDEYWNNLVLAMIGETMDCGHHVTGVRLVDKLSGKGKVTDAIRLELWYHSKATDAEIKTLRKSVEKILITRLDNSQGTGFKPDAMQDKKHTAYGK
mmetsp:Transcript_17205/g.49158  ORF Transcript_17205/g.49158 Transcript_17205/m.49158 type:complete len:235 (-) Transcript_17205:240-944(-)|eukprot:CAMPEP_0176225044 /NCGR_PEP_ID=MMETSP0121_2-20121125/21562_1 /TAXON_ID=160619 /ORGANISM="Kryptoperidinium foliaceum, Strain CCMP 1326" /LENGTH=234 /DNA_ID=CAMNT_0017564307 /DNA_START=503 /DNA_END=1207 /DNA_ORIENTATION=+